MPDRGSVNLPKYCYIIVLQDESGNQVETADSGCEAEKPLLIPEGMYKLSLKIVKDDFPYKHPRTHAKILTKSPNGGECRPTLTRADAHEMIVVFKSDDVTEKEEKRNKKDMYQDGTLFLGNHTLRPGESNIMLIGKIMLDYWKEDTEKIYMNWEIDPVNLQYWVRVGN